MVYLVLIPCTKTYWNGLYNPLRRTSFHPGHRVISLGNTEKYAKAIHKELLLQERMIVRLSLHFSR
jgi:hypothetical protein